MSSFALKMIAMATMLIDHIGAVLLPELTLLRVIGRVSFPIFVFLLAEGFCHTKNAHKFLLRLGAFALISQPFFDLALGRPIDFFARTNIFYTLFLAGVAIVVNKYIREKFSKGMYYVLTTGALLTCVAMAEVVLTSDYGAGGVYFIFFMFITRRMAMEKKPHSLPLMIVVLIFFGLEQHEWLLTAIGRGFEVPLMFMLMIPATLLPVLFLPLYNGKRGRDGKVLRWVFYGFYPGHLAVLWLLRFVTFP